MSLQANLDVFFSRLSDVAARRHSMLLVVIILFGTLLRLYAAHAGQGYHDFAINDEIAALQWALAWLAGEGQAQYLGQPAFSQGQLPGPLWTLLWVLFYKLGGDSVTGVIYGMALLNSFAIYLVYLLARQLMPAGPALLSSLLFAIAPWAVFYSTGAWNPLVLALLGGLLLLSLWRVISVEQSRAVFWVCLLAAAIPQFHMIGIFYAPAILLVFYLQATRLNYTWFMLGAIAGVALYVPYLLGDMQHDWANTRRMLADSGHQGSFGVVKIISAPLTMLSSIPGRWFGETFAEAKVLGNALFGSYILLLLFALLTLLNALSYMGGFSYRFVRGLTAEGFSFKRYFSSHRETAFIAIMLVLPLLLFMLTRHNYASRYSIIVFPLLFLLPALFLSKLRSARSRRFWFTNLLLISIVNIYMVIGYYHFFGRQIEHGEKFMASFTKLEAIRQVLRRHAGDGVYINVQLTGEVNNIAEIDRKTKAAISQYLDVYQSYLEKLPEAKLRKTYLLTLSSSPLLDRHELIYQSGDMAILAQ